MSNSQEDQSKQIKTEEGLGFQPGTTSQPQPQTQTQSTTQPAKADEGLGFQPGTTSQPTPQGAGQAGQEEESDDETPLDYYEVLGLKHSASSARIEQAYKNMALRYHPQNYLGSDTKANETRFAHLSEAYQVLSDPDKRREYDEYLKKNKDKFRDYQNKHQQECRQNQRNWRQLPVIHFRFHPYSPFKELFGYRPMNPFDMFNQFMNQGLFEEDDLDFYGWGHRPLANFGGFPRIRNDFFGDNEIRDFMRGHNHQRCIDARNQAAQGTQDAQQPQETRKTEGSQDAKRPEQTGPIEISRSIVKHTKIENGVRTTITETKKVGADGHVDHVVKEEVDDGKGNKRVRYLNALPELKKKEISDHQSRTSQKNLPEKKEDTAQHPKKE